MINFYKYLLFIGLFCASLQSENYSYSDLLNNSQPEQIKALQEVSSFLKWDVDTRFHTLEGGLTRAKLYWFELEGNKYVLRFLALTPSHSKEMRQNEIRALQVGNKLGLAPDCIFTDQNTILMAMPFVQGHSLHQPSEQQLKQIGKMLMTLHNYSDSYPTKHSFKDMIT